MGEQLSTADAPSISTLETNFQRGNERFFGDLCGLLWPDTKLDVELQQRTGATDRMCRNWIAGSHPPNARAVRVVLGEILRRLG